MSTPDQLTAFEEQLLAELKNVVAGRSAPVKSRSRRRLVLVGAAAAVALTAAGVSFVAFRSSPAYAVERDPDGSVRVYIHDYRDPEGLQRRLAAFGIRASVNYLPAGMACKEPRAEYVPPDQMPRGMVDWSTLGDSEDHYFKVFPQSIGANQTFVYTVQVSHHGGRSQRFSIRLANGPVAPCTSVPGDVAPNAPR
jgi:hypothetical protein